MGTELVGPFVKEDCRESQLILTGFESIVPIIHKNAEAYQVSNSILANVVESQPYKLETEVGMNHGSKNMKRIRSHRGMKFSQCDHSSGDEYESDQITVSRNQLPKGIFRGCEACGSCQKVIAKWHPEDARRPDLEEAPVFYPSEKEFEDTLKYISSIRAKAETYGICRIVPPPSWKPPCPLKEKDVWEGSRFVTRVQQIDKLQRRSSMKKILHVNYTKKRKRRRDMKTGVDSNEETDSSGEIEACDSERFGFEPGLDFTLDAFQKYADYFMKHYFRRELNHMDLACNDEMPEHWQPSLEEIEGEYWRIVEKPTDEIEVLYGADIETEAFGSGFPKKDQQVCSSDTDYIYSGWNLNNFPRLPGSVLSYESSDISGVVVPWLYIGMCFSSFCWHVEDHHLYSLNYMHWGAAKMWYGVPASGAVKLEAAMRKHLPDLFDEQPDLLHKLVTQISPSILKAEGIPVYRCAQNPGEFVLTFPRAYHAGFNCGFNCAEAVNVAPVDWLPHGQNAIELYQEQCRKTSISHDKLLLGAAREAVKANWEYSLLRKFTPDHLRWKDVCGKDGLLSKALKARVEMERKHREFLCKSSQSLKMESSFDADSERECSVCYFDLHISAAGCHHCSPDKYACLNHAKQLCSCSWGAKFYLFRYDINELNVLVEALEGKLSAVYRWARLDLGLSLSAYVSKDSTPVPGKQVTGSCNSQGLAQRETNTTPVSASLKEQRHVYEGNPSSTNQVCNSRSSKTLYSPVVVLALENVKASATLSSQKIDSVHSSPSKNDNSLGKMPDEGIVAVCKSESGPSSLSGKEDMPLIHQEEQDVNNEVHVEKETSRNHCGNALENFCPDSVAVVDSPLENVPNSAAVTGPPMSNRVTKNTCGSEQLKVEGYAKPERNPVADSPESSSLKILADSTNGSMRKNVTLSSDNANRDEYEKSQLEEKPCNMGCDEITEVDADSRTAHYNQAVSCSSPSHQNVLDRYYRQKGPRIAKVVRRINCNVEPLDFGSVHAEKLWCDSRAIYTKGFRSRVKYIDALDPTNMCNYISEILDIGRDEPLFMVSMEHNPSEVFVHVSAARCWDMVRERVNQEIKNQHKLGKANLPPLQPPGSLDGMEMFGFSSPAIIQAIQVMDLQRTCYEYWKSRPLMQIPQQPHCVPRANNALVKTEPHNDQGTSEKCTGTEKVLSDLFKKASPVELHTLHSLLCRNSCDDLNFLFRLLDEEMDWKP